MPQLGTAASRLLQNASQHLPVRYRSENSVNFSVSASWIALQYYVPVRILPIGSVDSRPKSLKYLCASSGASGDLLEFVQLETLKKELDRVAGELRGVSCMSSSVRSMQQEVTRSCTERESDSHMAACILA